MEVTKDTCLNLIETSSISTHILTFNSENEVDDVHITHHNHIEDIWKNIEMGDPLEGTFGAFESIEKRGRWVTRLRDMTFCYTKDALIAVEFDHLDNLIGETWNLCSYGHEDILTTAIGRPEHPHRAQTTGPGVGLHQYFGAPSRHAPTLVTISKEQLAQEQQNLAFSTPKWKPIED
ncbi:hypothetical protein CR513_49798, partial [Mucuna pruriens]